MSALASALLYASLAGLAIPAGALLARIERIHPRWLELELRHSVIAFGGGVLLAAIAFVLVPEGMGHLSTAPALLAFAGGGLAFLFIDRAIAWRRGSAGQLLAMLMDFLPESLALGALLATERGAGMLLALLIGLQNLPEGFNAYREMRTENGLTPRNILLAFTAIVALGPLMAWLGFAWLKELPEILGAVMLFAAGGILYLTFQDIAPQVPLRRHWAPPFGAVAGFMLGMLGRALLE